MSEHIERAPHVPPFVTFVTSAVPMVFDNSLSYYEALCALWKWLQDDVVNVINNNASVTEDYIDLTNEYIDLTNEYIEKFNELKEYVDTYFDNLDVQEEINNKLDAMVEDGTLQQLIASYLQTQIIYDTTLDMIADAEHLQNGVRVETLGYRTIDDNGAAFFVIKNTGTANGKSVIALDGGLYAHMIYKHDFVTPEMFGAYGDGVNDHNDSDAIQFAINTGKIVEFARKTYMCYSLTVSSPAVLHGNGATLKRPELDIAPYSMSVSDMKWIRTFTINEDCDIDGITFDNNCFTMWQVSDGYAQEQSASVIVLNTTKQIKFNITNCHFKNSAGDGLHIVQNVIANISNCTSEDCFRGGFVSTGYGSEISLNGWDSKVITAGVHDGFDIEVDTSSTVNANLYKLNISNVVLDYDLDVSAPQYGEINISNLTMRSFDDTTLHGFIFASDNGLIQADNCVLRTGKLTGGNVQTYLHRDGKIAINNSTIIGNATQCAIRLTQYQEATYDSLFTLTNCKVTGYNFIECGIFCGKIVVDGCDVNCSNTAVMRLDTVHPQVSGGIYLQNSRIKYGATRFMSFAKTASSPNGVSKYYLSNLSLEGPSDGEIYVTGAGSDVYYNNLVMESAVILHKEISTSIPNFYGQGRVITVSTASDLTFAGWVAGDDIAIAKDTGNRYRYTSGTTWTAI